MNEQTKQQKAIEFRDMVAELHKRAKELENAGLTVKLRVQRYSSSANALNHELTCEIFERKEF